MINKPIAKTGITKWWVVAESQIETEIVRAVSFNNVPCGEGSIGYKDTTCPRGKGIVLTGE